ncbi:Protein LIGHT-DEPENDENT SHORT HYPOCOTYLS 6 [Exaiptasia diaphana]|nr:Protein LIGHT-DEPENDENT SHORT HYPOCOTYLS 6 [Exaiptasia diaphana]
MVDKFPPSSMLAEAAAYIMCRLLVDAGYFIGIKKSQCTPATVVRFLGFECDSTRQAFVVPDDKRQKFKLLRENILASRVVDLKSLQRFAGKVFSFCLAIPGCRLYSREVFKAISRLSCSSKSVIPIKGDLKDELLHWRFLDTWEDCWCWRPEQHVSVSLYSDASLRAWGATLQHGGNTFQSSDYWQADAGGDINVLEARALLNAFEAFRNQIANSRVDVHLDSLVLKHALDNDGGKSSAVNTVIKEILRHSRDNKFSKENPAEQPSRRYSDADCTLSPQAWARVERYFGSHSFDLVSLDSNCRTDSNGSPLPHFTPWATPGTAGINVFAQELPRNHNLALSPAQRGPLALYSGICGPFDAFASKHLLRLFNFSALSCCKLDFDENFCQACGHPSRRTGNISSIIQVQHKSINDRFQEFTERVKGGTYQRQKSALQKEFEDFVSSFNPPKTISSCNAEDIIKFFKDNESGRTLVHSKNCSRRGCQYPRRLAAGTVDSLLGKIRAIFNNMGRLNDSNPVAHPRVKEYLKFVREEQAGVGVVPSQAVPLFLEKFTRLL